MVRANIEVLGHGQLTIWLRKNFVCSDIAAFQKGEAPLEGFSTNDINWPVTISAGLGPKSVITLEYESE